MHEILIYSQNDGTELIKSQKEILAYLVKYLDYNKVAKNKKLFKSTLNSFLLDFKCVDRHDLDQFLRLSAIAGKYCSASQLKHFLSVITPVEYFLSSCFKRNIAQFYLTYDNPNGYTINHFIAQIEADIHNTTRRSENQPDFLNFFLAQPNLISVIGFIIPIYKNHPHIFSPEAIERLNVEIISKYEGTSHNFDPAEFITSDRLEIIVNKQPELIPFIINKIQNFLPHLNDKTLCKILTIERNKLNGQQLTAQQLWVEHFPKEKLIQLPSHIINSMLLWCINPARVTFLEALILDRKTLIAETRSQIHKI